MANNPVTPGELRDILKESSKVGSKKSPTKVIKETKETKETSHYLVLKAKNRNLFYGSLRFFKNYAGSYKPLFGQFANLTWLPAAQNAGDEYDFQQATAAEVLLIKQFYQIIESYYDESWQPVLADYEEDQDGVGALLEIAESFNGFGASTALEYEPYLTKALPEYDNPDTEISNFQSVLHSYIKISGGDENNNRRLERLNFLLTKVRKSKSYHGLLTSSAINVNGTAEDLADAVSKYWSVAIKDNPDFKPKNNPKGNKGGISHSQYGYKGGGKNSYGKGGKSWNSGSKGYGGKSWNAGAKGYGGKKGGKNGKGGKNNQWNNNNQQWNNSTQQNGTQNAQQQQQAPQRQPTNNNAGASSSDHAGGAEQHMQELRLNNWQKELDLE